MKRLLHVLFWSVISAAFIGPGTITTTASAGARFEFKLLWTLLFSTIACIILQEASARITAISGHNLGQALRIQFQKGAPRIFVFVFVLGGIVLGCAAYEAGNILGSVAGASIVIGISPKLLTLFIGLVAGLLLYFGSTRTVAHVLGVLVAFMGLAFFLTALRLRPPVLEILAGSFAPSIPSGSHLLVLGLIGTTVVPYNLFLGSNLAKGQNVRDMRFGLCLAITLGGLISMGVLIVGTSIPGAFSFDALSHSLSSKLGGWAALMFAFGLFGAGFSSAVTAPLAASLTVRSLLETSEDGNWTETAWRTRSVWMAVLVVGLFFGLIDVRPIPAIIAAQALNGILLPFIAVFLYIIVNSRHVLGASGINRPAWNVLMGIIVFLSVILGFSNLSRAVCSTFGIENIGENILISVSFVLTMIILVIVLRIVRRLRNQT